MEYDDTKVLYLSTFFQHKFKPKKLTNLISAGIVGKSIKYYVLVRVWITNRFLTNVELSFL